MSKLNPSAQKWVEALRSGKYEQTRGALRKGDWFCCLGVACELAIESGVDIRRTDEYRGYTGVVPNRLLPPVVGEWLRLKGRDADWSLAGKNDSGKTFAEIADLIEQHADELFISDGAA